MKVLVTGGNGLVAAALKNRPNPHHDYFFVTRKMADLTKENEVSDLFSFVKPDYVIHAAARVGGIGYNLNNPAESYRDNILINTFVMDYAAKYDVKKCLALSSVCVFSGEQEVLREEDMQKNEPYKAEFAYGFAKRGLDIHIRALNRPNYSSLILTNLFGPNDSYNLENAHVIPSLIHKFYLAKKSNEPLKVWGTGQARREFLYSRDLSDIINQLTELDSIPSRILISRGEDISIKEIVEHLANITNFKNKIIWEVDKPEGQRRRTADLSVLKSLAKINYTDIKDALRTSYLWFEEHYPKVRM